jgi:hypothetical protein
MTTFPPTIKESIGENLPAGIFKVRGDTTKYIVERRRFERPSLRVPPNGPRYEWPLGVEGIGLSGNPGLAIHNFLGDNAPVVQIVHRDSRRIRLTGILPGDTGSDNVHGLIAVIEAVAPLGYWILTVPAGILRREQQVVIEDYSFDHPEDDPTGSWTYSISLIRTGVGARRSKPKTTGAPVNPVGSTKKSPKGKSNRIFTTKSGGNTLRAVAALVYGNAARWREIHKKNTKLLNSLGVPLEQLQYKRLPYGMKLNY